jgi:hypothetical protein
LSGIAAGSMRVTLRDDLPPTSDAAGIALDPSGTVIVPFADRGGGLRRASLLVDDRAVDSAQLCQEPFVDPVPCPTSGTVALEARDHRSSNVAVELIDASGNRSLVRPSPSAPPTPTVDSTPVLTVPVPVPVQQRSVPGSLTLDGAGTRRVPYSKPPTIKGTVKTSDGAPLAGVVVTSSDGTTAKTDGKGRFSVKLAKGVSREVRISYSDSVQTVKVIVAAPIRFKSDKKTTRNGRSITFTGSVPGAGKAKTRVELQALANGKWIPFKTAELKNGNFKAGYRFTRTFFTQRYSFRAVIHEDDGFPYAAGKSAVVRVVVRA